MMHLYLYAVIFYFFNTIKWIFTIAGLLRLIHLFI